MREAVTNFEAREGIHEVRIKAVKDRLDHNRNYYTRQQSANKTLGTFADAALQAFERPYFLDQISYVLSIRDSLDATHLVKLLERCYQADLLEHDSERYPDFYRDDTHAWLEAFDSIEDDDVRSERVLFNLLTRNVQSNIAERYKTIKLLASLYRERFGDEPSHLDVGSSVLHGSLKLALAHNDSGDALSFGDIELKQSTNSAQENGSGVDTPSREILSTWLANRALHSTVRFGEMVGTDITNVDDPGTKNWVESCSFYPDELTDITKRTEYNLLEEADPLHERVAFVRADFSDKTAVDKLRKAGPRDGYDIISLITVFYQVSREERKRMLENAFELLSDNGIIVVQDAADGNFSKDWNYTTTIMDKTRPDLGSQEILHWRTPRCTEAAIGLGKLSVRGTLLHIDEALRTTDR